MRFLRHIDELEAELQVAESLRQQNYDNFIKHLAGFRMDVEVLNPPTDPYSEEYRYFQKRLYSDISGIANYDPFVHEADNTVRLDASLRDPYPFVTKDTHAIGSYLMGVANIVLNAGGAHNSKVLEYGPGWGHVSIALARAGFQVTVVDVERKFLDLISARSVMENVHINCVHGVFGDFPDHEAPYDVIVFFECFHHAFEFQELLTRLRTIIKPEGRVLLAAEAVYDDFDWAWGIRLDGQALWAIRRLGWMELGFRSDFFTAVAQRSGFSVERSDCPTAGPFGSLLVLRPV